MSYYIDNIYYSEEAGNVSIFQKCSEKGIDLPCFCYHENLSIAGNCRMCLVEINTSIKLVVSCAIPMQNNIKILTNSQRIRKARENIIEFLLINHPLDCPICDQGGECDLQDITLVYGSDKSRFYEYNKRAVLDKECGPFIKMIMTRCIHCTRCIRFLTEIENDYNLGMVNRGNNSEISGFIKTNLISELSGNIIDLCPVGALTSKPFAFTARAWELNNLESIDILDSIASSIRIDFLNNKIYRILPIYDKNLNEDWITNKIRFSYDSQYIQRLFYPLIKINQNFININWLTSFFIFIYYLLKYSFNNRLYSFFGNFSDLITVNFMNNFFNNIGIEIKFISNIKLNIDFRFNYLINDYLINLNSISNIIIFGLNLRIELPLLNTKLKKIIYKNKINVYYNFNNNYNLKNDLINFKKILIFRNKINLNLLFSKIQFILFNNKKNYFSLCLLFGLNFFNNNNFKFFDYIYNKFNKYYNNFYIYTIISNLSYINFLEYGKNLYNNNFNLNNSLLFLNNIDDEIFLKNIMNKNNFLIYNGSFFDNGAKISNLIFPIYMFFEYNGFFLNIYGNLRKTNKIINTDTFLYSSYELFNSLAQFLNSKLINFTYFFNNLNIILKYFKILKLNWKLEIKFYLNIQNYFNIFKNIFNIYIFNNIFKNNLIKSLIFNFYKNDVITKNSKNLHLASFEYLKNLSIFEKIEKKFYCEKKEKKFYIEKYHQYNNINILLMKIFQTLNKINFKLNPIIEKWLKITNKRNYSSSSQFDHYKFLKFTNNKDIFLQKFLDRNFSHLHIFECKEEGEFYHIIAFQFTDNRNPVKFLSEKKIPVFQIEKGKDLYMSFQGIEFRIAKTEFNKILKNKTEIDINKTLLEKTPELLNEYIDKGLISILNIQTLEEKGLRGFKLTPYKTIEEFKNELFKPIKKD